MLVKEPYELTKDEFIKAAYNNFAKQQGRRSFVGILYNNTLYPLPKNSQHYGKFTRHPISILSDIHRVIIEGRLQEYKNGQLPNALPYEMNVQPITEEVLKDYPDIQKKQSEFQQMLVVIQR